jgi:ubiquinone/menaquinone biosynthesis C-methylase UbiE
MRTEPEKFDHTNDEPTSLPSLYGEFAQWFPILTSPEEYAEEAEIYHKAILSACASEPKTLLELGSGGGNNASHLKKYFQMTLIDLAPNMLEVSRNLNPECEHIQGDMRTVRLGRQFDAVFIHDAIMYMKSEEDLRQAIATTYNHCKPGGASLFTPDWTRESFHSGVTHGGHDTKNRSMRYLEWNFDPDPTDTQYVSHMVYLLRKSNDDVQCIYDRHDLGLFGFDDWMRIIGETGFRATTIPLEHSEVELGIIFVGIKPG